MNEQLMVRAELDKLANTLGVSVQEVGFLGDISPADLRELRERVTASLFSSGADALRALAKASKLLPAGTVASIAQRSFGPMLCARAAGFMDVSRAIDVAQKLPVPFLAELCIHLDPARAEAVIRAIPDQIACEVADKLLAMREFITLGRFVGYVRETVITAVIRSADPVALLHVAFYVEAQERFDSIADALSDDEIGSIIRAAAGRADVVDSDLWVQALSLLDSVSADRQRRLADIAVAQPADVLDSMITTVHAASMYDALLPLVTIMSDESKVRLAAIPALHDSDRLHAIVQATAVHEMWTELLPLVEAVPESAKREVALAASGLPKAAMVHAIVAARESHQWPVLLTLAEYMPEPERAQLIALLADIDLSIVESFVDAALTTEVVERALALLNQVGEPELAPVVARIGTIEPESRSVFVARATELGVLDRLGIIGDALRG
ncbi:hypothetical protein [Hoyosella altamirensis]|uniref:Uncharacterized protein n=1 Tax=Hoyosella altamirensis TaxID=616997 RepID=A0A839RVB1_9ACTN|nr:hypothetical protein [Hoyosella altamirensis]MBB3039721.1 hypothetical protein [Hoyosella altamirensis]